MTAAVNNKVYGKWIKLNRRDSLSSLPRVHFPASAAKLTQLNLSWTSALYSFYCPLHSLLRIDKMWWASAFVDIPYT